MYRERSKSEKQPRHLWLLLIWLLYFIIWLLDQAVGNDNCWITMMPVDSYIPFCEFFSVFYVLWFPSLAILTLYTMLCDTPAFRRFMMYVLVTFVPTALAFLFIPNGMVIRAEIDPGKNFFTWIVSIIYSMDTPTNAFPSLHVIGCFGIFFTVYHSQTLQKKRWAQILTPILMLLILVSTMLIKQHSLLDVLAAVPVSVVGYFLVYKLILPDRKL